MNLIDKIDIYLNENKEIPKGLLQWVADCVHAKKKKNVSLAKQIKTNIDKEIKKLGLDPMTQVFVLSFEKYHLDDLNNHKKYEFKVIGAFETYLQAEKRMFKERKKHNYNMSDYYLEKLNIGNILK